MRKPFIAFSIISLLAVGAIALLWQPVLWVLVLLVPFILLGLYDMVQTKHAIVSNFPVFGRGRYFMEFLRPKIYQYFVESDINGRPFSRIQRSVVYQRAKKELDTSPFGTQLNVYEDGYEWVNHSINALDASTLEHDPRVQIGGPGCTRPYNASLLNVSAMSYGALSKNAIMALNGGAKIGGFAHNTGEGAISPYHQEMGGDLIWQLGTGYFGCRNKQGKFDPSQFKERACLDQVKMIEIKLSQGAKPGHGGILPAGKNTPEIAAIRGVEPYTTVASPPAHTAFSSPTEMMEFIGQLRELSGGKPVGFKLCLGSKSEFLGLCKAMQATGITPDFIVVDGGEGGTGAAPIEFANSVGMPLIDGLVFAYDALTGFDLKKQIKLGASGKIVTGFQIFRALALGADFCYSARGMMMALGCIQALECNKNNCPTGVATQDPQLVKGLHVGDKKQRVANFHLETIKAFVELLGATGLPHHSGLDRNQLYSREAYNHQIFRYDQIFPYIPTGSLLKAPYPNGFDTFMQEATATSFVPQATRVVLQP